MNNNRNMDEKPVVLVSGASAGIGRAIAKHLTTRGYRVFGTSRDPGKAASIDDVEMLALDVCDDESIRQCIEQITGKAGRIDVLVNNAGYALTGAGETTSALSVKAQFETNYFGLVNLTNAVLPGMRARKSGQIINISSMVGFAAIPFMAHYSASKFAVEGYSETLHQEVVPFGIKVNLIQPGVTATELFNSSGIRANGTIADYAPWQQRAENSMAERSRKAISPDRVASAVLAVMKARNPVLRTLVGPDASLVSRLKRFVPQSAFQKIWRKQMGLEHSR